MENEKIDLSTGETRSKMSKKNNPYPLQIIAMIATVIILVIMFYGSQNSTDKTSKVNVETQNALISELEEYVLPSDGVVLPVSWGNLGTELVSVDAIDADKFKAIYEGRGAFTDEYKKLLLGKNDGKLKMAQENAGYLLNLFWALGLASKNPILDTGEMVDPKYGGAGNFASTGGWTIAKGNPMDHYSKHTFFNLTKEQQAIVDKVSRGIYRPCCGNSTHFPDCNHGMAMLGLLELMASQGVSEQDMWKTALSVNAYWFPDTYLTIATYMKNKGIEWKDVNPQEVLGANYSSGQGFAKIASQVTAPSSSRSGGGCGVDTGAPITAPKQQAGCGVDTGTPAPVTVPKQQIGCGV